jgi:hypothetical protein
MMGFDEGFPDCTMRRRLFMSLRMHTVQYGVPVHYVRGLPHNKRIRARGKEKHDVSFSGELVQSGTAQHVNDLLMTDCTPRYLLLETGDGRIHNKRQRLLAYCTTNNNKQTTPWLLFDQLPRGHSLVVCQCM